MPYSSSHAMGEGLVLYAGKTMKPLALWPFSTPIQATAETHPEYRRVIEAIVRDYGVGAVLVSSLIGHALDSLDTGLPTVIVNHDYYPFCPAIQIYFGGVCQHCDSDRLAECAANNPDFNPPHRVFPVAERIRVRERYLELVESNAIALVVPSRSAREHLERLAPRLGKAAFVTTPHGYPAGLSPMPHHGLRRAENSGLWSSACCRSARACACCPRGCLNCWNSQRSTWWGRKKPANCSGTCRACMSSINMPARTSRPSWRPSSPTSACC
jgi:hypothetical protein